MGDEHGGVACGVSHVGDGPEQFLEAVTRLVVGGTDSRVGFEGEPVEYRWIFNRRGSDVAVRVVELPQRHLPDAAGDLLWAMTQPVEAVARVVVRGFDNLAAEVRDDDYRDQWHAPFPRRELEALRNAWRASSSRGQLD